MFHILLQLGKIRPTTLDFSALQQFPRSGDKVGLKQTWFPDANDYFLPGEDCAKQGNRSGNPTLPSEF